MDIKTFESYSDFLEDETLAEEEQAAWEKGFADGEVKALTLAKKFVDEGRLDDLTRAIEDPAFRKEMYKKFE